MICFCLNLSNPNQCLSTRATKAKLAEAVTLVNSSIQKDNRLKTKIAILNSEEKKGRLFIELYSRMDKRIENPSILQFFRFFKKSPVESMDFISETSKLG